MCTETDCANDVDDDGDGLLDCADDDCWGEACHPAGVRAWVTGGTAYLHLRHAHVQSETSIMHWDHAATTDAVLATATGVMGRVQVLPSGASTWDGPVTTCTWTLEREERHMSHSAGWREGAIWDHATAARDTVVGLEVATGCRLAAADPWFLPDGLFLQLTDPFAQTYSNTVTVSPWSMWPAYGDPNVVTGRDWWNGTRVGYSRTADAGLLNTVRGVWVRSSFTFGSASPFFTTHFETTFRSTWGYWESSSAVATAILGTGEVLPLLDGYDDDGDGWSDDEGDCDDQDAGVSPEAEESCNFRDDDCDGSTDEDGAAGCITWYVDSDHDGYGAGVGVCSCLSTSGYTSLHGTDCYDANVNAYPGSLATSHLDRGDGSFDYDCDGIETPSYTDLYTCEYSWFPFWPCESYNEGWVSSVPACGVSSAYGTGCVNGWDSCEADFSSTRTQFCR